MKTTPNPDPKSVPKKKWESTTLVLKLERNQKGVGQLRNQLNSYICEPRTYSLFERVEALKRGLDSLSHSNLEMIVRLRERQKLVGEHMEKVRQQMVEFQRLQQDVKEYMQGLRGSY
ncbi:MAG: hypothetical protein AAGA86_10290 [Bacteroidota bacterium]